jgi:multidrug efflux pump subunit AcrB
VDYPGIQVQADYLGASLDTVTNNIATLLERQFIQITGLELVIIGTFDEVGRTARSGLRE